MATGKAVSPELGKGSVRGLLHLSLITEEGTRHVIPEGVTQARFKQQFGQLGINKAKERYIYADNSEISWMESLPETLKIDTVLGWIDGEPRPVTYSNLVIEFTVT